MNFHRLRQPMAVWLALLIAVFAALAPTLSLATSGKRASTQAMGEICSNSGQHDAAIGSASGTSTDPTTGTFVRHCPLCLHAADRVLPPPQAFLQGFGIMGEPVAPTIGQAFLFIALPARVPPPRGPPEWV